MRLLDSRIVLFSLVFLVVAAGSQAATINEIRHDNPGTDTDEYFELAGTPGESLNGLTYVMIGDFGTNGGVIETAVDLTGFSIQAGGYFTGHNDAEVGTCAAYDAEFTMTFENGDNVTHLLVTGFTGNVGDDIDVDDDGNIESPPWTSIVDCVAVLNEVGGGDPVYCSTTVGPNAGGAPDHVFYCTVGGWTMGADNNCVNDTPGSDNIFCGGDINLPPMISFVNRVPTLVEPTDTPTITADITDSDGTIASANLLYQVDGGGYATLAMSIVSGDTYSADLPAQVSGSLVEYYVEATDDDGDSSTNPDAAPTNVWSYTVYTLPVTITPIADIQADPAAFDGILVTVQGQVYCPGDYKADGNASAYIQDGSGRGINIFSADPIETPDTSVLNDTGNIVSVSGWVDEFFTTREIVDFKASLVSSGNPPLSPAVQPSTAAAAAPSNEGNFIESTGEITVIDLGVGGATNVTVDDGSGPVVMRIDEDVDPNIGINFNVGDIVTGRGAGSTFGSQGQILICSAADFFLSADVFPPGLVSAELTAASSVTLTFTESMDPTTSNDAGNYEVYETGNESNTIAVTAAALQLDDTMVVLTLASPLPATSHTVRVNNVEDLAGNPIAPNTTALIVDPALPVEIVINEVMINPEVLMDTEGEWFEIYNAGAGPADLNGWTIRDDDIDSHVIVNGGPLIINPGEYKVLTRNAAAAGTQGIVSFYEYGGDIAMANSVPDELVLEDTVNTIMDQIAWDVNAGWPIRSGWSMQFTGGDNTDPVNWAYTGPAFGDGDRGTPGAITDVISAGPPVGRVASALHGNHPNPFNPLTTFSFSIDTRQHVNLAVFNVRGQKVRTIVDSQLDSGLHDGHQWNGRDDSGQLMASGTYYYRLKTENGFVQTKKMTLVK